MPESITSHEEATTTNASVAPAWNAPNFPLVDLPGLSKEFYELCADWKQGKDYLFGMLKHYKHGQTHTFDDGLYEVQILFRPLTVRLLNVHNTGTGLMAVERMAYILADMAEDDEYGIDVKVCFDSAVLIQPSLNFDTYYYERRQAGGHHLSDEHGTLNPHESAARSYGISSSAMEVV